MKINMELNNWPFFRFQLLGFGCHNLMHFSYEITGLGRNNLSNENNPWCLGYIGDYMTQLYGDYFINHYKDPYETTRIQWKVRRFFCGSLGKKTQIHHNPRMPGSAQGLGARG